MFNCSIKNISLNKLRETTKISVGLAANLAKIRSTGIANITLESHR
jgi:hypothetical protein